MRSDKRSTGLEYVLAQQQRELVERLQEVVKRGGRLIIGVFKEERAEWRTRRIRSF